jgi:hypothetical protein
MPAEAAPLSKIGAVRLVQTLPTESVIEEARSLVAPPLELLSAVTQSTPNDPAAKLPDGVAFRGFSDADPVPDPRPTAASAIYGALRSRVVVVPLMV